MEKKKMDWDFLWETLLAAAMLDVFLFLIWDSKSMNLIGVTFYESFIFIQIITASFIVFLALLSYLKLFGGKSKKFAEFISLLMILVFFDLIAVGLWFGIENTIDLSFYLYLALLFNGNVSLFISSYDDHKKYEDEVSFILGSTSCSLIVTWLFSTWIVLVFFSIIAIHLGFLFGYLRKKDFKIRGENPFLQIPVNLYLMVLAAICLYFFYPTKGSGFIFLCFGSFFCLNSLICIILFFRNLFSKEINLPFSFLLNLLFAVISASVFLYIYNTDFKEPKAEIVSKKVVVLKEQKKSIPSSNNKQKKNFKVISYYSGVPIQLVESKVSTLKEKKEKSPKAQESYDFQDYSKIENVHRIQASKSKVVIKKPEKDPRNKELLGILDMRGKLNRQLNLISIAQDDYSSKMSKYKKEIRVEKQKHNITLYSDITKRIVNNMLLIQEIDAYNTKLSELKKVTKSGLEESVYMERRLNLKENMVSVTGSTKSLGKDIEKLLKKYDSYTEDFVINPEELELKPLDEIWKQIDS